MHRTKRTIARLADMVRAMSNQELRISTAITAWEVSVIPKLLAAVMTPQMKMRL
jgi:hypothetical protein